MFTHSSLTDRSPSCLLQARILEPLIGHAGLCGQCPAISPLFPVAHSHPSPEPVVNFRYWTIVLRYPKIVHPCLRADTCLPPHRGRQAHRQAASEILDQLLIPVLHGDKPTSPGQLFDPPPSFNHRVTATPLPSANTFAKMFTILAGFTYRGVSPHKFTPMPGVHKSLQWIFTSLRFVKTSELKRYAVKQGGHTIT